MTGEAPRHPSPADIRAAREAVGLTQAAAAVLIHSTQPAWRKWEAGERRMHPAMWELFRIKVESRRPLNAI